MIFRVSRSQSVLNNIFHLISETPYDCEFIVEEKYIEAHKMILRAVSPVFDVSLTNDCISGSNN